MADIDELELLNLVGGGQQEQAAEAYDRLLGQTNTSPTPETDPEVERLLGISAAPRGWQGYGQALWGGIVRNFRQIQAVPATLRAVGHELTGDVSSSIMASAEASAIERNAPEANWRLQDVRNLEEFGYWLTERFGENALTLLTIFASGGAGLLAGKLGARALGGGKALQRTAGTIGMLGGGYATTSLLETAGTASEQADVTGFTQPHLSIPAGLLKGALELWTPSKVLQALNLPGRQLGRTVLGATGKTAGREFLTEGLQESIDVALRMHNDPNYSFFGDGPLYMGEGSWRVLEAAVAGGAIGGIVGLPAARIEARQENQRKAIEESGGLQPGEQQPFVAKTDVLQGIPRNILRKQPEGRVEVYRGDSVGFERPNVEMAANVEPGLFFTTDLSEADLYARGMQQGSEIGYQAGSNIRRTVLDTTNMKEISWRGDPQYQDAGLRREAQKAREEGFSGVWVTLPMRKEGVPRTQYVVWDQKAIMEPGQETRSPKEIGQALALYAEGHEGEVWDEIRDLARFVGTGELTIDDAISSPETSPGARRALEQFLGKDKNQPELLHRASIQIQRRQGPKQEVPAPQTPLEQEQPGPVTNTRDRVLVGPRLDRDLGESTQPAPQEDMWAVGPLLRSGIPSDLTDYYRDIVDAAVPRYALQEANGQFGNEVLTNTDLEYAVATRVAPAEKPTVYELDQTTLVPAAITASLLDLPEVKSRRIWFLPGTSAQEQTNLLSFYAQLKKMIVEGQATILTDVSARSTILTAAKPVYDELLSAGLRVVPSRGTSFYYMGNAPITGKQVEPPTTTGRSQWWTYLTPNGELLRQSTEGASVFETSDIYLGAVPVTFDGNKFSKGEVSVLPHRRGNGSLVYFSWSGGVFEKGEAVAQRAEQDRLNARLEDWTPAPFESWTKENIENFREVMRQGIYIDPMKHSYAERLITLKDLTPDQLIEGVNYARIGPLYMSSASSNIVDINLPATNWSVSIEPGSETNPQVRELAEALRGWMPIAEKIMKGVGIERAPSIVVREGTPAESTVAAQVHMATGKMVFPVSSFGAWHGLTGKTLVNRSYVVLMHELGHLVMFEYYKRLPVERQSQLDYAYNKMLLSRRAKVVNAEDAILPVDVGATSLGFDPTYYSSYVEWLAEQFRRFTTSDGVIMGEMDRVYAQGADILNEYIKGVTLNDPVKARNLFEPDYFFSSVMQYIRDYAVTRERVKQIQRAQTLYSVDTDILSSPALTEVTSKVIEALESMRHMMPEGHPFNVLFSAKLDPKLATPERNAIARTIAHGPSNKVLLEVAIGSLPREDNVAVEVFAHELIHAYRMLGLITPSEMNALYASALRAGKKLPESVARQIRNSIYAMKKERGWDDAQEAQELLFTLQEETVAYYVGEYVKTGQAPAEVRGLLERIIEFWNKVRAALRGEGFNTRDSIMRVILSGEMAQRGKRIVQNNVEAERYIRTWFTPDSIVWDETIAVDEKIEARIEKNMEEGKLDTATYQFYDKVTNFPVGQIRIETDVNGRGFNVIMQHSSLPGKALEWLRFIEKDLQLPVLGPPIFTKSGLRAAGRIYPDVLKYYVAGHGLYYSPKYITENLATWEKILRGMKNRGLHTIDNVQFVHTKEQVRFWQQLHAKIPKDIWTSNKHLLDQLFMLPRNWHKDEMQGVMSREGQRADEAQMAQILGESQRPGSTFDSFTLERTERNNKERRTAAEQLGIPYAETSAPQPEVMNIRRILAWMDRRGATTDPRYEGYLKRVPQRIIVSQEADRIGFFSRVYWGLRQLIWRNEHIGGLQSYGQKVEQYHATITSWHKEADEVAREWEAQIRDPRQREQFNRLLHWLVEMNYRTPTEVTNSVVRHPTQQELIRQMRALGLNVAAQTFLSKIYQHPTQVLAGQPKDIFARFLDSVEQVSVANIMRTLATNPVMQAQAVTELRNEMNSLRAKPYVPISRFGQHTITVRDSDPTMNNRVLWFSVYDTHIERDAALAQVARLFPLDNIHKGRVPEEFFEFLGLPGPLIKEIKNNLPGINATQMAWLEQLEMQNLPDKSFRKRWVPRVGTPGYSMDFFRSFAHYFMHGSRYLARLQYRNELYDSIASVEASIESLPNGSKRRMIVDYMKAHLRYLMEGGKDWAKFKAAISLLQLGFSPAAAAMNLTQTPMVSLPWLQGVFGTTQGMSQLLKSLKAARNLKNGYITSGVGNYQTAREEMVRQGRIDIGQAAELGSYAEGNNLLGLLAGTKRQKMYRQFTWYGMIMFQKAEQINREVLMHAAWELAHKQMNTNKRIAQIDQQYFFEASELSRKLSTPTQQFTHQDALAFILAKEALDQTQGLYAPYARPPFMRGKVAGTVLIFYQFIQLMTYAFRYNPGMIQMWLLMAFVYGLGGLPASEDLNEVLKFLAKKLFGKDFDIHMQARKMVREITRGTIFDEVGPDLFLHGISRYSFGLGLLPDGYGVPRFDASANGSMGKLIPGLYEGLHALTTAAKPDQFFSDLAQRAAGAGFGWFFNLAQFFMEGTGTVDGHKWEQALPRTMRAMAAALRYLPPELNPQQLQTYLGLSPSVGAATLSSGARIARFAATDPDDVATIVAQLLGFRPTKVAEAQELRREQLTAGRVLQARRGALMVQMAAAMQSGQISVQNEVLAAIMQYNKDVAAERRPELSINSMQLRQSLRGRVRTRVLQEQFVPPQRQLRPTYESLRDLFPGVRTEQVK